MTENNGLCKQQPTFAGGAIVRNKNDTYGVADKSILFLLFIVQWNAVRIKYTARRQEVFLSACELQQS